MRCDDDSLSYSLFISSPLLLVGLLLLVRTCAVDLLLECNSPKQLAREQTAQAHTHIKSHWKIHLILNAALWDLILFLFSLEQLNAMAFWLLSCAMHTTFTKQKDDQKRSWRKKKRCWLCNQVYFMLFSLWATSDGEKTSTAFNKFSFYHFYDDARIGPHFIHVRVFFSTAFY